MTCDSRFECRICGEEYDNDIDVDNCEKKHKSRNDIYFERYLATQKQIKLKKAALDPRQTTLNEDE